MKKQIRQRGRLAKLPRALRVQLVAARRARKWSQAELGKRTRLPQAHISAIENGKIVPRFDTALDLVRVLGNDLVMIPRALGPAVQALIRDHQSANRRPGEDDGERPLYAFDESEEGHGEDQEEDQDDET